MKIGLTAAVTAALTFAIAAAMGFGATAPKVITMKVHQIISLKSGNFHCQALTTTEVACGANVLGGSTQVYFTPRQLNVVKFNKAGTKGQVIYQAKR